MGVDIWGPDLFIDVGGLGLLSGCEFLPNRGGLGGVRLGRGPRPAPSDVSWPGGPISVAVIASIWSSATPKVQVDTAPDSDSRVFGTTRSLGNLEGVG